MIVGWAVLLVLLVVVAVVASGASPHAGGSPARARLDERLAAGDLTVQEHAERVAVLDEGSRGRDIPWVAIAVGAVVLLVVVGIVGWAAGGTSMAWWGDPDRMMAGHMGWSSSSSGGADRPVVGAREVGVTATDLDFDPGVIEIRAGEPVNITLVNDGAVFHDLTIPDLGFMLDANPGEQVSGSLTVDEPGRYQFVCSVPGHADAGMRGTLQVRGGSR